MVRIGVDVGGTGIQIGALNSKNEIIAKGSIPTAADQPFAVQVQQIVNCILETVSTVNLTQDDIEFVGVGIPGIAAPGTGEIIKCTNMGWNHVPFGEEFKKRLNKPIMIDNDANVAALAESVAGISKNTSSSVFITIGTGIGSGIIINDKIWSGFHGIGGELGHTILKIDGEPCTCGNNGCLERYCSATAIIRMGREEAAKKPESLILSLADGDLKKISAKTVFEAARKQDSAAMDVFQRFCDYLGQAIANVVNFLDPEVIVLGGGVSKAGAFLLDNVRRTYRQYVVFRDQPMPAVELAVLGADAGIIGAAMLS